jgi:FixJ family two-component response regulator
MNDSEKVRVLIADDEESFLRVVTAVLEGTNRFDVQTCESGDGVIERLKRSRPDVLVLDHKMPGKSGLNVLQLLHEQKSNIPVIVLTGHGSENIAVEAMKLGAYDYVRKDQFDKHHFPLVVASVYERFLFKKEKERREREVSEREKNLATFELLRDSVLSFSQIVHSSLTTISLLTDESERLLQPLVLPEGREYFKRYFNKVRGEYETLSTVTKSIVSLSKVMYDNYEGMQAPRNSQSEAPPARNAAPQKSVREQ